jgi:hypothetical protein
MRLLSKLLAYRAECGKNGDVAHGKYEAGGVAYCALFEKL